MIYLVDDKKYRQSKDYNWSEEKLNKYKDYIIPVYTLEEFDIKIKSAFKRDISIILYHESFIDNTVVKADEIRKVLDDFSKKEGSLLAFFSGSKFTRSVQNNIAHLPVSILYQNLEVFVQQCKLGDFNLSYLLFGENPETENHLRNELSEKLHLIEEERSVKNNGTKNIFFRPVKEFIAKPIEGAREVILFNKEAESDEKLSNKIKAELGNEMFDNIFIPLCFGDILSDYNGLRLATLIRITDTPNQLSNIFIYSFIGLDYLINNEFFNILKTKNVRLVDFNKKAFEEAINGCKLFFFKEELSIEIVKLKLDPPKNYEDNHSVANEWAIFQWAKCLKFDLSEELQIISDNIDSNLYFKYLKTINPVPSSDVIKKGQLQITKQGDQKVLLIDDQADKGWNELLAYLFSDINNIYSDFLGDGYNNRSSEEIITESIKKIQDDDIDLVILDFRLNSEDFSQYNPENITSVKLLKSIKKINPGIQVVIFSATNKVWNLQALQEAGADGFILKDSVNGTCELIINMINTVNKCLDKANWLKPIWRKTSYCFDHLESQRKKRFLDADFVGAVKTYLELGFYSLITEKRNFSCDSAFMYYFLILEAISKQLIDEENPHKVSYISKFNESAIGYKFQFRGNYNFLKDYEGNEYMQVKIGEDLIVNTKRIPYNSKFHNLIAYAGASGIDPVSIVKLRNAFNHPNLIENKNIAIINQDETSKIFEVCVELIKKL